ncbi:sodium:calcium antiporter [Halobellus sp. Atlit-38R]|jgi:cation:H+ antiporter|uniref:sodium:calcium antiporter n=1 Tax=Halobellus sp. Atlit-38R TaxID=2282131 RepID=UPI000EF1A003|nr:sodium:calcium antiporter [Halobellus sp. Atlit-38R]RLM88543.1 sodium:calcium antiporter [Halobellus sp. Atlit-38R]
MTVRDPLPGAALESIFVVIVATGVIWVGSRWLEESAEHLAGYYGLPAVIQGSIIVAVGSSFPELVSVVLTSLSGTFGMGVGAIVGSAVFNILVIPALAGIVADGELVTSRTVVYKEAQFYMIAIAVLVVTFALAVIYHPLSRGPTLIGELTRPLAMLPLLLYGLYLFVQWQDISDYSPSETHSGISKRREWGKLAAGLLLILVAVEGLVTSVESLGHLFSIPEFFAGVTIIAAATSLPDLLVSVRAANAGKGITSVGNVLGSNTFDLLVTIPVGVLIVGVVPVNFTVAIPMLAALTLATVLLFTFLRTDLVVTNVESYVLLGTYVVFLLWVVAETTGMTQIIHSA